MHLSFSFLRRQNKMLLVVNSSLCTLWCRSMKWVTVVVQGFIHRNQEPNRRIWASPDLLGFLYICYWPLSEMAAKFILFRSFVLIKCLLSSASPGLRQALDLIYSSVSSTTHQRYSKIRCLTKEIMHVLGQFSKKCFQIAINSWCTSGIEVMAMNSWTGNMGAEKDGKDIMGSERTFLAFWEGWGERVGDVNKAL